MWTEGRRRAPSRTPSISGPLLDVPPTVKLALLSTLTRPLYTHIPMSTCQVSLTQPLVTTETAVAKASVFSMLTHIKNTGWGNIPSSLLASSFLSEHPRPHLCPTPLHHLGPEAVLPGAPGFKRFPGPGGGSLSLSYLLAVFALRSRASSEASAIGWISSSFHNH